MNIVTGSLEGSGTIASKVTDAGTILPGGSGAGALNITNDLTLAPTSAIQIEIGGITQGSQYDLLSEAGTVALTLQGTLSVTTIDGFVPDFADTFTVLTSNQPLAGAFSNVANGARYQTGNGLDSFQVNYGPGKRVWSEPGGPQQFFDSGADKHHAAGEWRARPRRPAEKAPVKGA